MDRYKCLEAFVQVAETGSLSAAARNLSVAKSTVSERLSQLEAMLGSTLVYRSSRKLQLTHAGRASLPEFADIVARLEDAENALRKADRAEHGHLRVASAVDLGTHEIGAALARYRVDHPLIEIDLSVGDHLTDPIDSGFDIAFHYRRLRHESLKVEPIATVACGLYASPAYLAEQGVPNAPADLTGHRCLGYLYQKAVHEWVPTRWDFERRGRQEQVRVRLDMRSNSSTVLTHFALAGQGLAVLPEMRARAEVGSGKLVPVLAEWNIPPLTLYATYPRTLMRTRKIVQLTRFMTQFFAADGEVAG